MMTERKSPKSKRKNGIDTVLLTEQTAKPVESGPSRYMVKMTFRLITGSLLFIAGFNFSNTAFFRENPLFGIKFLAETLISLASFLFGFFVLPTWFAQVKNWFERVITKTVTDIVTAFWIQQSTRIQEKRREKQKIKDEQTDKELQKQLVEGVLLDTSVLIDGRILDIAKLGFISSALVVPKSVLHELHLISDNQESIKRQRGRRGMEIVHKLKKHCRLTILENSTQETLVDKELVSLAKKYNISLMTLDFNLNKLATASGIKVLNLNDLANALKTVVLPGEILMVKIMSVGKEKSQGVGYMPDGTMIIVEGAKEKVGEDLDAKVTKVIQTQAGKMIFCSLV